MRHRLRNIRSWPRNKWLVKKKSPRKSAVIFRLVWLKLILCMLTYHGGLKFLCDEGKISQEWTNSFLKKNPLSPRKSAMIVLLVWQSTTVCMLSNDGGFPSENHRGNPPWFSFSCGRTITYEDYWHATIIWTSGGEPMARVPEVACKTILRGTPCLRN